MFVKVYRYRVQPEKSDAYLAIQEKARMVYRRHVRYRSVHLRSQKDPGLWFELHWYPDEESYRESVETINADPEIDELWKEFESVLDPDDPEVSEEDFEQILGEDPLPSR